MLVNEIGNVAAAVGTGSLLAPAFAAGFAVQRFLDIVDSWIDLEKWVSTEWKKAILSFFSLLIGIFLAYRLDIRILTVLSGSVIGETLPLGLDYFVSGLIVSAGTEGFNSIFKFMNYSKEVKKAQIATEQQTALSARSLGNLKMFAAMAPPNAVVFQNTGDLSADLETSLHDEIQSTWGDKLIEATWSKDKFSSYTIDAGDAKEVVLDATLSVAQAYSRTLSIRTQKDLQAVVDLDSAPEDILPRMRNAVLFNFV